MVVCALIHCIQLTGQFLVKLFVRMETKEQRSAFLSLTQPGAPPTTPIPDHPCSVLWDGNTLQCR